MKTKFKDVILLKDSLKEFSFNSDELRKHIGEKGAKLAELINIGFPVPQAIVLTTSVYKNFENDSYVLNENLIEEIQNRLYCMERILGKNLGDENNPLLLSIRSSASVSMPAMMDTILNIGINDSIFEGLKSLYGKRFACECYIKLLLSFSKTVFDVGFPQVEKIRYESNTIPEIKDFIKEKCGHDFPQDIKKQLLLGTEAVFKSWKSQRAKQYRELNKIPEDIGTAVIIQNMVYGNLNINSLTGVAFSRNPSDGKKELYGEYLFCAQGEDITGGIKIPENLVKLKTSFPEIFEQLHAIVEKLEKHYRDVHEIEFTVEDGILWILQTRQAKRNIKAAVKIAVDMVNEGLITKGEAISRIDLLQFKGLFNADFDSDDVKNAEKKKRLIGVGLNASPGVAIGKIVFSSDELKKTEEKLILVKPFTDKDDINSIKLAEGILTTCGGMTSHAAIICRSLGKPCVVGLSSMTIDSTKGTISNESITLKRGDIISIDGKSGKVFLGEIKTTKSELTDEVKILFSWMKKELLNCAS